jgi:hypothetical protein
MGQFPRTKLDSDSPVDKIPKFTTQHYTVGEIAALWKLSHATIRKLFAKEPDVLVIESQRPHYGRRRYSTLRIPEFVVERVHRRLSRP